VHIDDKNTFAVLTPRIQKEAKTHAILMYFNII